MIERTPEDTEKFHREMAVIAQYFAKIGSKGGKKSKRALTPEQAREMVKVREAKKK